MESIKRILSFFIIPAVFMILPGCAWIGRPPAEFPFDRAGIRKIIDRVSRDNDQVATFISSGQATFKNWAWGAEAKTLLIGQREPLRLKIELTHSWGVPILHILIRDGNMEILSFSENRLYRGTYSPGTLSKFIDVYLEIDYLWSILRGYPALESYDRLIPSSPDRLILADQEGKELETLGIDLKTLEISSTSFPGSGIRISFSGYVTEKGIPYAKKIRVDTRGLGKHLILSHEGMVFNREMPAAVFTMRTPPGFEIIDLDNTLSEPPSGKGDGGS